MGRREKEEARRERQEGRGKCSGQSPPVSPSAQQEVRWKFSHERGTTGNSQFKGTKTQKTSSVCRGDALCLSSAPPCLNRGLNGLRRLRGLPHTAQPPVRSQPQALSPSKRQEVRGEIHPPPYRRFVLHGTKSTQDEPDGRAHPPCRHRPIPPAPVIRFAHCRLRLCLRGKGERMAFLKVCIQGCFDGFGRMDHAIEPQTPLAQSLAKPFAIPPSS